MDQCSRILAFYKSGMPIRDRSITSLWSKTRDRPSRIGITDWHPGLFFRATVSYLPMVDSTYYTNSLRWFTQRLCASIWFAWSLLRREGVRNSELWSLKEFQILRSQDALSGTQEETARSVQTTGLLTGGKCSLMVGVGCLEIVRVASDSGGDFGFLTRSSKN